MQKFAARMGVDETGMGNVGDKILKHHLVADKTPGTERMYQQQHGQATEVLPLLRWDLLA